MPGDGDFRGEFEEQSNNRLVALKGPAHNGYRGGPDSLITFAEVGEGWHVTLKRPGTDKPGITMTFEHGMLAALRSAALDLWILDLLAVSFATGEVTPPVAGAARMIGNGVPDLKEWLSEPASDVVALNQQNQIRVRLLRDHKSVVITGPTGSGKSTQVRFWAQQCLNREDRPGLIVLNLIDLHDGPASVVEALLLQPNHSWYLLVIEDIHLNQGNALAVFALVDRLRAEAGLHISVLATGRVDRMQHMLKPHDVLFTVARPQAIFDRRLGEYPDLTEDQRRQIETLCGNGKDLNLLDHVCTYMNEHNLVMPGDVELVQYIGRKLRLEELTEQSHRNALYHFACMGMFEIDVPAVYALDVFHDAIEPLRQLKLIEPADTSFRVQSRSIGAHLARYAMLHWNTLERPVKHPAEVAAQYLDTTRDESIKAVLNRVWDIVDHEANGTVSRRVTKAWERRRELARALAKYVAQDPEWGQNAASAAFASIAMSHLDLVDRWALSAEWVRENWDYGVDGELPRCTGSEPTVEFQDFAKMREHMKWAGDDSADDLDLELAHRIWMTAVLLWMEVAAPDAERSDERIGRLAEAAKAAADALGFYYPSRVPWVTARVLISLCDAEEMDSEAANAAAQWLAEQPQPGWTSGTGLWNTDAMTTAMCLIALRKHNHPTSKEAIKAGYGNLDALIEQSRLSSGSLSEIDKVLCAEAYLLSTDKSQREKGHELLESVQEWLHTEGAWSAGQSRTELFNSPTVEPEGESTKLAFVVCQVAACVWNMARKDLPLMFEDIAWQFRIPKRSAAGAEAAAGAQDASAGLSSTTAVANAVAVSVDNPVGALPDFVPASDPVLNAVADPDLAVTMVVGQDSASDSDPDPDLAPTAGGAVLHEDSEILTQARNSVTRIEREITRNIDDREEALRNRRDPQPLIEAALDEWFGRSRRLTQITTRLNSDAVTLSVIQKLDALGKEALAKRWRPLLDSAPGATADGLAPTSDSGL